MNVLNQGVKVGVECFLLTSSIAVDGRPQTPMREGMVPQPEDPYGVAKCAVELDLRAAHEMFGLDYIVFRPQNVYGERQHIGDRHCNVIASFSGLCVDVFPFETPLGGRDEKRATGHYHILSRLQR